MTGRTYCIEVSQPIWRYLNAITPKGITWDEIMNELLIRAGYPYFPKASTDISALRMVCIHPNKEIKTGLWPNPEEIWQWCPDCNLLIEKVIASQDTE